jgi:PKD domain-containing protein
MSAGPERVFAPRLVALVALVVLATLASAACASADFSHQYHEVTRFGGFDKNGFNSGTYGDGGAQSLMPGMFLEATGFAVDREEPEEAIYVADRTSEAEGTTGSQECVSEGKPGTCWRIQKLGSHGQVLGTTTFTLPGGNLPTAVSPAGLAAYAIAGLAVDHTAGRLYALVVGPLAESNRYRSTATAAVELLAWSTKPEPCPAGGCPATGGRLIAAEGLAQDSLGTTGGVVSTRAQLEEAVAPAAAGPLYDPQGIVVDNVQPVGSKLDDPVAIEAKIPDAVQQQHREEGAEEEYSSEEGFDYSEFEARGNTIVQQVATEAQIIPARPIGALGARWSSSELGKENLGPLGIFDDTQDKSMSVLLRGPEGRTTTNAYVLRLQLPLPAAGKPVAVVLNAGESASEPPLMRLDPGPFFTEPDDRFQAQRAPEAIRNAGPEAAQLENGIYAADLRYEEPTKSEVEEGREPYWRAEQHYERKRDGIGSGVEGVNVGVRLLQPVGGQLADSHGASIVNTLGNSEPWSTANRSSACSIDAEEPALAAGREGRLWVLDRGPTSEALEREQVPESQWGHQLIEFAPNASKEEPQLACPQPSGTFSMQAGCGSSPPAQGTLEAAADVPVEFDASSVDLGGATPAAYEWKVVKLNVRGEPEGEPELHPTAAELAEKKNKPAFNVSGFRKFEKFEREFKETGTYKVTLDVPNDYGAYEQSALVVVTSGQGGSPHAQFIVEPVVGAEQAFNAEGSSAGVCAKILDYRWNWGEGRAPEDDGEEPIAEHTYPSVGEAKQYTVTLTVLGVKKLAGKEEYVSSAVTETVEVSASRASLLTELPDELAPAPTAGPAAASTAPSGSGAKPGPARGPTVVSPHPGFSDGVLKVSVSCPAAKLTCAGTVRAETADLFSAKTSGTAKSRVKAPKRRLALGETAFSLAGGTNKTVTVHLTANGAALLRKQRRLVALVIVSAHDPAGDPGVASARLTLVAPAGKPRRAAKRS